MWRQQRASSMLGEAGCGELPLICFTVFVPAATGAGLFALPLGGGLAVAIAVVLMTTVGMLASVAHLARPLRAPRSLSHLDSSWLSREILVVSAFWLLALLWAIGELDAAGSLPGVVGKGWAALATGFHLAASMVGMALLWVIARAYRVHGQPAWNGPDTFWELVAAAVGSGGAVAAAVCAWQASASHGPLPLGSAFGCGVFARLCLVSLLAVSASCLIMDFAHRRRVDRVAALAKDDLAIRAREAWSDLAAAPIEPRAYRFLGFSAGLCSLIALAMSVLLGTDGSGEAPIAAVLSLGAILELAAQAFVRNRFYSLAQHLRHAVARRR